MALEGYDDDGEQRPDWPEMPVSVAWAREIGLPLASVPGSRTRALRLEDEARAALSAEGLTFMDFAHCGLPPAAVIFVLAQGIKPSELGEHRDSRDVRRRLFRTPGFHEALFGDAWACTDERAYFLTGAIPEQAQWRLTPGPAYDRRANGGAR